MVRSSPRLAARRETSPGRVSPAKAKTSTTKSGIKTARPLYHSDGDTRPLFRGASYAFIRRTGIAWVTLTLYAAFAIWSWLTAKSSVVLLCCRAWHVTTLVLNVVYSDDLHNLDLKLGPTKYKRADTVRSQEQLIHARDWRAALGVPASYHILLIFGIVDLASIQLLDATLLAINISACGLMFWVIRPARITPARELFLAYVVTFVLQMGLLLAAFWRAREEHGAWLPLWFVYAVGLVFKGVEWPDSMVFGHHEVLHACTIIGHVIGILIDVSTTGR